MSDFYALFSAACNSANRTPTDVVTAAGLSSCLVTAWGRDGASPRINTLLKLANELNIPVNQLLPTTPFPDLEEEEEEGDPE